MSHRFHPDASDPQDAILFDNCEDCEQHAKEILSLDGDHVARLWNRTMEAERGHGYYRTHAEAQAGRFFWRVYLLDERGFLPDRTMR